MLYKHSDRVSVGGIHRFVITYKPEDPVKSLGSSIFLKIKNNENILLAPAFLNGPYILYVDVREADWTQKETCFITDEQPAYEPNLIPGQSFTHELKMNKLKEEYAWTVEIASQIVFSTTSEINFELVLGKDSDCFSNSHTNLKDGNYNELCLNVQHLNTLDIWNKPPKSVEDPIHLVILTHGLHSNLTADMAYLNEQIELMAAKTGENIVIRGYSGNVCRTERGVKYLGRRLAEYIVNESLEDLPKNKVKKISFIAHSLGGLVQTFAISYIHVNYPHFFHGIKPENFITMASPLLGLSNENPAYVKISLKFGIVGKSGQDMSLFGDKPLLLMLPGESTRAILRKFKRRTVYANVLNDGIVPLRTSALLYLDWKGLSKVYETIKQGKPIDDLKNISHDSDQASEIPTVSQTQEDVSLVESLKSKIQATVGFCLPSLQVNKVMSPKYRYFQAKNDDDDNDSDDKDFLTAIPKSNVITSIKSVILPPLPSPKFINDPASRVTSIIHDKIYTPSMIPKLHTKLPTSKILAQFNQSKRQRYLEEKIARRWHMDMTWRKVLVVMKPDAHNNMIVRRRFANAYGWEAVDHMVENHFGEKSFKGEDISDWELPKDSKTTDVIDIDVDSEENDKLTNKLVGVMGEEYKKEHKDGSPTPAFDANCESDDSDCDINWMDNESGFYDGPTGMINNVNEGVDRMRGMMNLEGGDLDDSNVGLEIQGLGYY